MADTFTLARRLKAGETVYTGWCGLPYPLVTEIIAREKELIASSRPTGGAEPRHDVA